jgi:hypothetical protein
MMSGSREHSLVSQKKRGTTETQGLNLEESHQAEPVQRARAVSQFPTGEIASRRAQGREHFLRGGVESHDDLCDGLTTLLNGLVEQGLELPKIHWIET